MAEAIGRQIEELTRIRIGPLELGDLRRGEARRLDRREIDALWEDSAP
jgi:16S rRNA U516 pseudouridylate synthase RsuA-like enzyme